MDAIGKANCGLLTLLPAAALLLPLIADAQRTDDNAVTAATDAFGTTVGLQTVGLYSPTNARGFNPTQAENLRIEGLYFDQQTSVNDLFLFSGSDMRVGIAAQSYSFPSPTGIADYKLRTPGDSPLVSGLMTRGPFNMTTLEIDAQYPIVRNTLSVGLNVADWQNFDYNAARSSGGREVALLLRFRPTEHTEIVPFFGRIYGGEHQELPTVYADGVDPLPIFQQQQLPAQDWSSWGWSQNTGGIIAASALGGPWTLRAGLFLSTENDPQNFNDLLVGLLPSRTADHVIDVVPPLRAASYSGDLRLVRLVTDGAHQHELTLALRGRQVARDFGGDSITDLGVISITPSVGVPEPPLATSPASRDDVRQTGIGISYIERWQDIGTLSLGALKTDYSRSLSIPGTSSSPQRTAAVLPNVSFTADAGRLVTLYGSYTRGLEDSLNAPTSAANRGEPPPATATWQVDGGVRMTPRRNLQVLLGAFEVHKAYFNLDAADRYEQLGEVTSRGVEGSATLNGAGGLTIVGGFVFLKPKIDLQIAELGATGTVPVGPVPRTININVDYAPSNWGHWAASLQWTWLSSRVETTNDLDQLPPLATLNLGVRFSFKLFNRPCSARFDAGNLTNAAGLTVSPVYVVLPELRRNYTLTLAIDI